MSATDYCLQARVTYMTFWKENLRSSLKKAGWLNISGSS